MPGSNLKIRSNLMLANVPENSHLLKREPFRFLKEPEVQFYLPGDFAASIYAHKRDPRARDGLTLLQQYEYENYMTCQVCKNICVGTCESGQGDSAQAQEREAQIQSLCAELDEHRLSLRENAEIRSIFKASSLFQRTAFWHWVRKTDEVMNDLLFKYFIEQPPQEYRLQETLDTVFTQAHPHSQATPVLCVGDQRFIVQDHWVRLAPDARQKYAPSTAKADKVQETKTPLIITDSELIVSVAPAEPLPASPMEACLQDKVDTKTQTMIKNMAGKGMDPLLIAQIVELPLDVVEQVLG